MPPALSLLSSERPRNVGWFGAAGLLFGDWGTSRLYVLGLAFLVAGRSSFWLIAAMSLLILAVGWAYTQICRIYPDGGGVYTAAKHRSRLLAVIGALLLFADYTVTASLSVLDGFHYFGLGGPKPAHVMQNADPGDRIEIPETTAAAEHSNLFTWPPSPGLCAILAILAIGALNLMGPKHTAGYAVFAAAGMMVITLLVAIFALPQVDWHHLNLGRLDHRPWEWWRGFVYIVLALSGVEAIANLTGVMHKPVYATARKSIWTVAAEVATLNLVLALAMINLAPSREGHMEDMLAFMAHSYVGAWGEWPVRIIGGLLLLSAGNTAVNGLMSIIYVMSRDGEMPAVFQKLNSFGAPWVAALVAAGVPALVLIFLHDVEGLSALYAIGVVGAVAINCTLCSLHPRLRPWKAFGGEFRFPRRIPMFLLGLLLIGIWLTLAWTKISALMFVSIVLAIGLSLRQATKLLAKRRPRPSLLRQAILEQLTPEALARPKFLLATAGSDAMADPALELCQAEDAALVVVFIREVALSYKVSAEARLTLDTDPAAQALFADFLTHGHRYAVPIIPVYDSGVESAELIAETAAIYGCQRILIGTSRRGAVYQIIKGSFQRRLESLLPPEIPVQVLRAVEPPPSKVPVNA